MLKRRRYISQFTNIVNDLKPVGRHIQTVTCKLDHFQILGTKIHKYTKRQRKKPLPLDPLLCSLITHEMMIGDDPSKMKKSIAFKVSTESGRDLVMRIWFYSLGNSSFSTRSQMQTKKKLVIKRHPT